MMKDEKSGVRKMPKKGLALLLGPPKAEDDDTAEMSAQGILDAIKAGSAADLRDALQTFLDSRD